MFQFVTVENDSHEIVIRMSRLHCSPMLDARWPTRPASRSKRFEALPCFRPEQREDSHFLPRCRHA
jgi:hypothetical protein